MASPMTSRPAGNRRSCSYRRRRLAGKRWVQNRYKVGTWETFDEIDAGNGWVALFAHADRRFVTAESAGAKPLIANRTQIGLWEQFKMVTTNTGQAIQARVNGRYVTAESAGTQPLIANRTQIGLWESFTGLLP